MTCMYYIVCYVILFRYTQLDLMIIHSVYRHYLREAKSHIDTTDSTGTNLSRAIKGTRLLDCS